MNEGVITDTVSTEDIFYELVSSHLEKHDLFFERWMNNTHKPAWKVC